MRRPCDDTLAIVQVAILGLHSIDRPGITLAQADVMLLNLTPARPEQFERNLGEPASARDRGRLM